MREAVGIPIVGGRPDKLNELQIVAAAIPFGNAGDARVQRALLDAAGMIRDLHIVLDTGTEIQIDGKSP
ncbi:hypothetical protein [Neorhizobium tomejilense]|uniref:hypothetical protein n=1 Tax=Neorhizobium tomejilense TaxID=2093828 RepID=UPI003ED044E7